MLDDIVENDLYFDSDDSEDERNKPNFDAINAAETVDDLISAGNNCLSSDQDKELVQMDKEDRVKLRRDSTGPLTCNISLILRYASIIKPKKLQWIVFADLKTRLDNTLMGGDEEEDEDEYSD
ncbi:hypothetical protein U1Q18_046708 [Sarracenia purpurea var. burkii]